MSLSHLPLYLSYQPGRVFLGRLAKGSDPLKAMEELAVAENITMATLTLMGAVTKARLAYYAQDTQTYGPLDFLTPQEITASWGNISVKDGKPFAHIHLVLGDHEGKSWSGHLASGTEMFAGEFIVQEILGPALHRDVKDLPTGLSLWSF